MVCGEWCVVCGVGMCDAVNYVVLCCVVWCCVVVMCYIVLYGIEGNCGVMSILKHNIYIVIKKANTYKIG